ncbi:MAG: transglutaminase domain-containing protein [Pirellulales bacterium]
MKHNMSMACGLLAFTLTPLLAPSFGQTTVPTLPITEACQDLVPLFDALPVNDCQVTSLVRQSSDGLVIGATCGLKQICLFSFDPKRRHVKLLDCFEALWSDEPKIALGPEGDIYLGARHAYDKQFTFERIHERPHTPGAFQRRDSKRPPNLVNAEVAAMPIRHYSAQGQLLEKFPVPQQAPPKAPPEGQEKDSPIADGIGALAVCAGGSMLAGLTAPGGRLVTISLETQTTNDYGEVVHLAQHHHTRRISKTLMVADDGKVYFCGKSTKNKDADDATMGFILALDPQAGTIDTLDLRLPAVTGRHRFAAIDSAVKLSDGSFFGGTSDGYLFQFDPQAVSIEAFGKPLRQHNICGLAVGSDGWVYGVGGEPGSLPRLFAFEPGDRRMRLGTSPSGTPHAGGHAATFGEIGAVASTVDGTLICGERERRGYLLVYQPGGSQLDWQTTTSGKDLGQYRRDRFVDLVPEEKGVQLAPTYLISDAPARSSKIRESLSDLVFAKKIFYLRSKCKQAEVLFFGGATDEQPMLIHINGHEIRHLRDGDKLLTGNWDRVSIPGEYLRPGRNEIVFGHAGYLIVDTDRSGENSFKRTVHDGPWKSGILGPDNNLDGEYVVRIRVQGYPPTGTVLSPVIDLALESSDLSASERSPGLSPAVKISQLRLTAQATTPRQTSVQLELRSGSTPDYQRAAWDEWGPADDIQDRKAALPRFIQWRATLASGNALVTPQLRSVTVEATRELAGTNRPRVQVIEAPDNKIVESNYDFTYADPRHPRMWHLREKYQLDQVVAPGKTEMEKFALLRTWVRQQWEGWNDSRYHYCPPWDALEILELAPKNLALGMCTHYAAVFTQCAASLGYHARVLIVDHHCLTEIWSDQYGKWILQDPGLIPNSKLAFQYEVDGIPIHALEMHQRSLTGKAEDVDVFPLPNKPLAEMQNMLVKLYVRFGIPLRNDHLYQPEPQEIEHGQDHYHWDGYLWWSDQLDPKYPEYSRLTNRPEDMYWTLNKTVITLEDTEAVGTLAVCLSGPIPNLDTFMVRINQQPWKKAKPSFTWALQPGPNTLEAKAVNTMGIEGGSNRVKLEYTRP